MGCVQRGLAGRHRQVQEEVVVGINEPEHLGDRGPVGYGLHQGRGNGPQEERRAGPVTVVPLVAHVEGLGEQRAQVQGADALQGRRQGRVEHGLHPLEPLEHLRPIGPVAQPPAQPLVLGGVGSIAKGGIIHDKDRHGRRDDPGHRPHGLVVMARLIDDGARGRQTLRLLWRLGPALVQDRADDRAAQGAAHAVPRDQAQA